MNILSCPNIVTILVRMLYVSENMLELQIFPKVY